MEVAPYYPTELQMAPERMEMPPSERRPMQPMEIENGDQAHPQARRRVEPHNTQHCQRAGEVVSRAMVSHGHAAAPVPLLAADGGSRD